MSKQTKSEAAAQLGRLGGRAVVKSKGKAYMKRLAKKGARARWAK